MKNLNEDKLSDLPRIAPQQGDQPEDGKADKPVESQAFWARVKWLQERGMWKGDYREYEKPYYNLNKGNHYYVMDDPRKGSIKCLSCPVKHGGILEAHLLTRYTLNEGVLALDGKAINTTPDNFSPGD